MIKSRSHLKFRTFCSAILVSLGVGFAGLSGIVDRAVAGSTEAQQPALKLFQALSPDTLLKQFQSVFVPAQDFQPVRAVLNGSGTVRPPLSPARSTSTVAVSTTAIIRTFAGGSDDGAAAMA